MTSKDDKKSADVMKRENQTKYWIDSPNQDKMFESPDYDDTFDEDIQYYYKKPRNSDAYNMRPNRSSNLLSAKKKKVGDILRDNLKA